MKSLREQTKITETVFIDSPDRDEIIEVAEIIDMEARASSLKIKETHSMIEWGVNDDDDNELLAPSTLVTSVSFADAVNTLIGLYWGNFEDSDNLKKSRAELRQAADNFSHVMLTQESLDGQEIES